MTTCEKCDINVGDGILSIEQKNKDTSRLCHDCAMTLLTNVIEHPVHDSLKELIFSAGMADEDDWKMISNTKGANNDVDIFINNAGEKRVVRTAKTESFLVIDGDDNKYAEVYSVMGGLKPLNNSEVDDMTQNYWNWCNASGYQLSPKLYFYGWYKKSEIDVYFKNKDQRASEVHLCIISEGYDQDLYSYYKFQEKQTQYDEKSIDEHVANQLVELLQKSVVEMGILCFDLKPPNCVINVDTKEVRLIDWDSDWCFPYNFLGHSPLDQKLAGLLSTVFMANQFITFNKLNIFDTYFKERQYATLFGDMDHDTMLTKLKALYCSGQMRSDGEDANFVMVSHYQRNVVSHLLERNCSEDVFREKCDEVFDVMWDRANTTFDYAL